MNRVARECVRESLRQIPEAGLRRLIAYIDEGWPLCLTGDFYKGNAL